MRGPRVDPSELQTRSAHLYLTIVPWARVGYELAITISYPTSANGIIVLLNIFKLQTSGYYNLILVNFILNITKRPDINVSSGKQRKNHMTCAPFANFVEWKIWKGRTAVLKLFSTSTVFAFPHCDCGIWRWIGRPDWSSISFSSSTESELYKDPAPLINLLLLLFNGLTLVVGFTWGPLWPVMNLRKC